MNCCNEYGECRQGRDCPVRKHPVQYRTGWARLDSVLNAIAYGAVILFVTALAVILAWVFWGMK